MSNPISAQAQVSVSAAQTQATQENNMTNVISAQAPAAVLTADHFRLAQSQAFAPEVATLLNRESDTFPLTGGVLNALCIGRSAVRGSATPLQNQINLPRGWQVGMSFAVPACFSGAFERKGDEWISVGNNIIPMLDMLRVFGSEDVVALTAYNAQEKEVSYQQIAAAKRALRNCGYSKDASAAYAKGAAQIAFWIENCTAKVVVPSEFKPVLSVVFKAAYPKMVGKGARVFFIDTNWAKPAHGLDYAKLRGMFRALEQKQQELGFSSALSDRPITLVESTKSFEVYFGLNFSMTVNANGSVILHNRALGNDYMVKSVLLSAYKFYGEVAAEDMVVLNPFDVVFYMWENFHLVDINRNYFFDQAGKIRQQQSAQICWKFHHSTEKFALKAYPVQMITDWWSPSFAMERFSNTASAVMTGVPGLLRTADRYNKKSSQFPLCAKRIGDKTSFAMLSKIHARRAALVEGFGETLASELDSRRAIAAAVQHGFICQTYGNCSNFGKAKLYSLSPLNVEASARKQWLLDVCQHGWGKLAKKYGVFSDAAAIQFLANLVGIEPADTAEFWEVVCNEVVALNSTKAAKFTSRVDKMQFPVDLPLDGMERQRIRSIGSEEVRLVKPARFVLALGIPAEPGMSYVRRGFLSGHYITTGRPSVFYYPCPANPIILIEELAAVAVENVTSTGLRSWKFEGVSVEEGAVLAYFQDEAGNQTPVFAERDGELVELRFGQKTEVTGTMFYVTPRYKNIVRTHKARLNIKANLVESSIDDMLALNSDSLAADVIVMSDAFKASDLTCRGIFDYIGETFCRSDKYRHLIAQANLLVGVDGEDEVFVYDDRLAKSGKYQFLFDTFVADFGKDIWWTTPCTADYAQQWIDMYSGVSGAGFKNWRTADASEVVDPNVCLPTDAIVFTNAKGAIAEGDNIIATYTDEEGINWMCQRGFGFAGTEECPLYGPMLSEYSAIEQAVGDTSILAFDMVELGLAGKHDLAAFMLDGGDRERQLHVALTRAYNGRDFDGVETIEVAPNTEIFSVEERAALKEVETDRVEWINAIVEMKKGINYKFSLGAKKSFSLYIPAIAALGLGGLNSPQETMISKLYAVLRMLYNGYSTYDENVRGELRQLVNMVDKYLGGENHIKALVRGADRVTFKTASLPIIPVGTCVNLKGGRVERQYRKLGMGNAVVVGKWRAPIRNCVFQTRVVLDENNLPNTEFGRLYELGFYSIDGDREFDGRGQSENYGDYDGDGQNTFGLTAEQVAQYNITVTNYTEMMGFVRQVVGADMCSVEFWSQAEPIQQFYADHYWSAHKNDLLAKLSFDASKALISKTNLTKFLKSACNVQKVAVGKVYRTSAVHAMFAELLDNKEVYSTIEANGGDWVQAFDYVRHGNGSDKMQMGDARLCSAVIETLYEQMLGGYSAEMVDSILGNIARAVDGSDETEWYTPEQVAGRLSCKGDMSSISPKLKGVQTYTKVAPADAKASLAALGYSSAYLEKFENAAMLGGFANALPKASNEAFTELASAMPEFALVTCMAQAVMDASQGREMKKISTSIYRAAELARSSKKMGALAKLICSQTATGAVFKKLYLAYEGAVKA